MARCSEGEGAQGRGSAAIVYIPIALDFLATARNPHRKTHANHDTRTNSSRAFAPGRSDHVKFCLRNQGQFRPPKVACNPCAPPAATTSASRSFTDAAEAVLRAFGNGQPMHYRDITNVALREGLLVSHGKTPDATMSAQIYVENDRRGKRGETLRFLRDGALIRLADSAASEVKPQDANSAALHDELLACLRVMDPKHFEVLVGRLLAAMGFVQVQNTPYANDAGVDVRAELTTELIAPLRIAMQVKRHAANIRRPDVQNLRGSLHVHERGVFITSGSYSKGAREEAMRDSAAPITLLIGKDLVGLLIEHRVGVTQVNGVLQVSADSLAPTT
nr:restriction endonuclease [Deinococcus yavapaiensis]